MKVLIVASKFPPEYSGPGVRMPRLYKAIGNDLGIERIDVLCGGIEYTENEDYEFEGFQVHRRVASYVRAKKFPFNLLPSFLYGLAGQFFETLISLRELKSHKDVDYVHVLGTSGHTAAALHWARKNNVPVMQELVTAKARPSQRFLILGKAKPPQNTVIVTFRTDTEEECRKAGYEKQVWNRPNPIDETLYAPAKDKYKLRRKHMPYGDKDIVISTVAKIIPQKNQIFLLDVMRLLPSGYKLVIAGPKVAGGALFERDKDYLSEIYRRIERYGLKDRVCVIPDYVPSAEFMKASDIYALPAYDEGFATPMLEAMACGLPVIANINEVSFREWIEDDVNGYLCFPDPVEWAEAIQKASGFPQEQMREVRQIITGRAGQKTIFKTYTDLISKLVKNNK